MSSRSRNFGMSNLLVRFIYTTLWIFITYNPLGYSVVHWVLAEPGPLSVGSALILMIGWGVMLWLAWLGIGFTGILLSLVVTLLLLWMAIDANLIRFSDTSWNLVIAELVIAVVVTLGLSWGHLRRRLSGQFSTDDVGEV